MDPTLFLWLIPLAFALDMYFGDPSDMPVVHPVRRIGRFLELLEPEARKLGDTRAVGALCALTTAGLTGAVVWLLTGVLPGLWAAFALYFAYSGLAFGCLLHTGASALNAMEHGALPEAQAAVGRMVSRDTTVQDRPVLYKSLAESLSENMSDAVTGPLFWLMLTGPVGLWVYKAVSTIDSMWGYKTPRWKNLGWAGARLDDALAFVPARLGALFLYLAARLEGNTSHWPGWAVVAREATQMTSPNSGWPMAVAAWTQHAGMGGPTVYFGEVQHKPLIGPQGIAWDAQRIRNLIRQMRLAGLLAAAVFYLAALAFYGSVRFFLAGSR
ncbi:MAG: cobalamin biosynthesis protein [Deltaproteobacteria bacterium]|nr:cobalamin biosynthesis protein [Deltaproteobacteria bacterium]